MHVSWVETFDNCPAFRCDNAAIYAVALSEGESVNVVANVSLTPTPASPWRALRASSSRASRPPRCSRSQSSQQTAPVNQTPVNQTPINQTAATNAPVNQTPINQTPVNQTPVNQSGFADLTQTIPALGSISLSSHPASAHRRLGRGALRARRSPAYRSRT